MNRFGQAIPVGVTATEQTHSVVYQQRCSKTKSHSWFARDLPGLVLHPVSSHHLGISPASFSSE